MAILLEGINSTDWSIGRLGTINQSVTFNNTTGSMALSTVGSNGWVRSSTKEDFGPDVDLTVLVNGTGASTTRQIAVRTTTMSNGLLTGYIIRSSSNGVNLYRAATTGSVSHLGTLPSGVTSRYWRLQAIGDQIKAKSWAAGDPEPASWDVEVTNSSVTGAGKIAASMYVITSTTNSYFSVSELVLTDGVGVVLEPVDVASPPAAATGLMPAATIESAQIEHPMPGSGMLPVPTVEFVSETSVPVATATANLRVPEVKDAFGVAYTKRWNFSAYSGFTPTIDSIGVGSGISSVLELEPLDVPRGALVTSFRISFTVSSITNSGSQSAYFSIVDADNAATYNGSNDRTQLGAEFRTAEITMVLNDATVGQRLETPNLASLLQEIVNRPGWEPGNRLVVYMRGGGSAKSVYGYGHTDSLRKPTYVVSSTTQEENVLAAAALATAMAPAPTVQTGTGSTVQTNSPMEASALLGAATVAYDVHIDVPTAVASSSMRPAIVPHYDVYTAAATATGMMTAAMHTLHVFATVEAPAAVANATTPAASFDDSTRRLLDVPAMQASAEFPIEYQKLLDPYYHALLQQVQNRPFTSVWLRLDETSGLDVLHTETDGIEKVGGSYVGTPDFNIKGWGRRQAVGLDASDRIDITEYVATSAPTGLSILNGGLQTLEFVFKTAVGTQPFMSGTSRAQSATTTSRLQIDMVDGHLRSRESRIADSTGVETMGKQYTVTSKNVADNEWHHVVFVYGNTAPQPYLQVYIDGKLALQRHESEGSFGRPFVQQIAGFTGALLELVQHNGVLDKHVYTGNYLLARAAKVQEAPAMRADATMQPAITQGTQKRALALYYQWPVDSGEFPWSGWTGGEYVQTAPGNNTDSGQILRHWTRTNAVLGDYTVDFRSVTGVDMTGGTTAARTRVGTQYIDEITGRPRWIDLEQDIDLSLYDMLFFVDVPPRVTTDGGMTANESIQNYERLFKSVRAAVDTGLSLWVSQPEVAVQLGLVESVGTHPLLREYRYPDGSTPNGQYDWRSWDLERMPNGSVPTPPGPARHFPHYYEDTHFLNKRRVTAVLNDFSEFGGWIQEDFVYYRDLDNPFGRDSDYLRYKLRELGNVLPIGTELYMNINLLNKNVLSDEALVDRKEIVGVPADAWHAGTAVAKEQLTYWQGTQQRPNPYADWTLSIAVQPGDLVKGTPIGGRVFIDFMESVREVNELEYYIAQVGPFPTGHEFQGWDYDYRRTTRRVTMLEWAMRQSNRLKTMSELPVYMSEENYPIIGRPSRPWAARIFKWLAAGGPEEEGTATVRAAAMQASGSMAADVYAERGVDVSVGPMQGYARAPRPDEADGSVEQYAPTMRATGSMPQPEEGVEVAPLHGTGRMPVPVIESEDNYEEFVLYVHDRTLEFYLLEDY